MESEILTQEAVRELFRYDDGDLIRRVSVSRNTKKGDIAGCLDSEGYLKTGINGRLYKNSRLVWLYHHGYMPEGLLDHIDRNRAKDCIENLREVSNQCNLRNSKQPVTNTSGVKGICWCKSRGKWRAKIGISGKLHSLGYHKDFTNAVAARLAVEQCVGWGKCDSLSPALQYMQKYLTERKLSL